MTIGDELFALADVLGHYYLSGDDVRLPPWEYENCFNIPRNFFIDGIKIPSVDPISVETWNDLAPSIQGMMQPSPFGFRQIMANQDFWVLEPPIVAVHYSQKVSARFYEQALSLLDYETCVVFGESPPDWGTIHVIPDEPWIVPHMMSFADYQVISDHPDSWWGAFLSESADIIYSKKVNDRLERGGLTPHSWRALNL